MGEFLKLSKERKIKNLIIVGITLISVLELFFEYKIFKEYRGVYSIGFTAFFVVQPLFFIVLFRGEKTNFKYRVLGLSLLPIMLPFVICFTLPKYTYNDGEQLVKQYEKFNKSLLFVNYSNSLDAINVINAPRKLFVNSMKYYYETNSEYGNKYFMVSPIDGGVTQLEDSFWRGMEIRESKKLKNGLFSLEIPANWEVGSIKNGNLYFGKTEENNFGGVYWQEFRVNSAAGEKLLPQRSALIQSMLPNHIEVTKTEKLDGFFTEVYLMKVTASEPAGQGGKVTGNWTYIIFVDNKKSTTNKFVAYGIFLNTKQATEQEALKVAKTFIIR